MTIDHHRIDRIARLSACYQAIQQVQDVLVLTADYGEAAVARDLKQQIAHKLLHINKKSACSPASPAPSDGASASSDSTAGSETSGSASASPHTPATPAVPRQTVQGAGPGTTDPSALIRADPKRPGWLKDSMLPLPVGTERVWWSHNMHLAYAFPSGLAADHNSPKWGVTCGWTERELEASCRHQVYLVPQPAPAPKHDAGKADGMSMDEAMASLRSQIPEHIRMMTPAVSPAPKPPPPRRSAREVAEALSAERRYIHAWWYLPDYVVRDIAIAAIERDREGK